MHEYLCYKCSSFYNNFLSKIFVLFLCFSGYSASYATAKPDIFFGPSIDNYRQNYRFSTKYYILKKAESIATILTRYNITAQIFWHLNPLYKTYSLTTIFPEGTLFVVPLKALPSNFVKKVNEAELSKVYKNKPQSRKENIEQYLNKKIKEDPDLSVNNLETEELIKADSLTRLDESVAAWLNGYGNASVALNLNHDGSLKDSELSLLLPVYKSPTSVFFAQNDYHHFGNHIQSNLVGGVRYCIKEDTLIGVNAGLQYDLTDHHARSVFGLEYTKNFLRLATNYYQPLNEVYASPTTPQGPNPAKGYSIEAEAYLPKMPSLGMSYRFASYVGQQVDIAGDGALRNNPVQQNFSISYTPIPLLQVQADYYKDRHSHGASLGLNLNYRLGVPFKEQLKPETVGIMRSLKGRRTDFLLQSKDIILDYKHHNF